jgi:hypothetical protein
MLALLMRGIYELLCLPPAFKMVSCSVYFSTLKMEAICSSETLWKTFIANRVAEIQEIAPIRPWRHVPSQDNPADLISRGHEPGHPSHVYSYS